jgi:hypothetical protein
VRFLLPLLTICSAVSAQSPPDWWAGYLEKSGLTRETAEKIVETNAVSWEILAENNPQELTCQLNQIAKLGKQTSTHSCLAELPETAGLLAATLPYAKDAPEKVAAILNDNRYRLRFKNYCTVHALDIQSCVETADIYKKHGPEILALYNAGQIFPAPETYFQVNPANKDAQEVYDKFRKDFLHQTLRDRNGESEMKLEWLYSQGFVLAGQLDSSYDLRTHFLDRYFPMMQRVAEYHQNHLTVETLLETPYIYNTFDLPQGETLVKMYGRDAAETLKMFKNKPEILQQYVISSMLKYDTETVEIVTKLRDEPELKSVLLKSIPDADKRKIFEEALTDPDRLAYYGRLSDSAILDDLHPYEGWMTHLPGYCTYQVVKKIIDGREVTVMEIIFAVIDTAFDAAEGVLITVEILSIPVTGGASAAAIGSTHLAFAAAKTVAKTAGKKMLTKQMLTKGIRPAAKTTMIQEVKTALPKLPQMPAQPALRLDISGPLRSTFDMSKALGFKNDSFKKMSGLDVRIFMRSDKKTVLNLHALPGSGIPKFVDKETTRDFVLEKPAEKLFEAYFVLEHQRSKNDIVEKKITYEQYQSALWLSAATGTLEQEAKKAADSGSINNKE